MGRDYGEYPGIGQSIPLYISVMRMQESPFPPVAKTGRIRILENDRVLLETNVNLNVEGRMQRVVMPPTTAGWHVYQLEYIDPTGQIGNCRAEPTVFHVGLPATPVTFRHPQDGILYHGEPRIFIFLADGQLTGSNDNGRVQVYNADTNQQIGTTFKELNHAGIAPYELFRRYPQPTTLNLRVDLLNQRTNTVAYRDPTLYRFRVLPETRFRVSTVTAVNTFSDRDSFELQAGPLMNQYNGTMSGKMTWFDGDQKLTEETVPQGRRFGGLFFLPQARLQPGLHAFRVEFTEAPTAREEDSVPSGKSAPFEVLITAQTRLSLSGEGTEQATANSTIGLRAAVTTESGLAGAGTVVFQLNGNEVGRVPAQNGIARLELRNLAAGSYRAEARLVGAPGYLESRGEFAFQVQAGVAVRNAASGSTALSPGALASLYGSGLAGVSSIQILDAGSRLGSARLLFVGASQINFWIPEGLATGPAVLTIARSGQGPVQTRVELAPSAPGLFTMDGASVAAGVMVIRDKSGAVRNEDVFACGTSGCRQRPVRLGDEAEAAVLVLYGTGWRTVGSVGVSATPGGNLGVLFAGAQPEFVGLDQVNVNWPIALKGRVSLSVRTASGGSNPVEVTVE